MVAQLRALALARCANFGWVEPDAGAAAVPGQGPDGYEDPRFVELQQHVASAPAFQQLTRWPAIIALLESVTGRAVAPVPALVCRAFAPGRTDATTPPHQDAHFLGKIVDAFWVAWMPLGACPLELGPLAVLRRSHRSGLLLHDFENGGHDGALLPAGMETQAWRTAPMEPGDVLLFHHLTVHRACPNLTQDRFRISADFRFRVG